MFGVENQINFEKYTDIKLYAFGQPYDFDSVMHYGAKDFPIDDEKYTLRPKTPYESRTIGQRLGLSDLDVIKLNLMYQCGSTTTTPPVTTTAARSTTTTVGQTDDGDDEKDHEEPSTTTHTPLPKTSTRLTTTSSQTDDQDKDEDPEEPSTAKPTQSITQPIKSTKLTVESACQSDMKTSCSLVQQSILGLVNRIRRKQDAANMLKVQWDETLMEQAQQLADECKDPNPESQCVFSE